MAQSDQLLFRYLISLLVDDKVEAPGHVVSLLLAGGVIATEANEDAHTRVVRQVVGDGVDLKDTTREGALDCRNRKSNKRLDSEKTQYKQQVLTDGARRNERTQFGVGVQALVANISQVDRHQLPVDRRRGVRGRDIGGGGQRTGQQ